MKKFNRFMKIAAAAGLGAILLMSASGCRLFDYGDEKNAVPLATPLPVEYIMCKVERGDIIKSFEGTCTVTSQDIHRVTCDREGYVVREYTVKPGDTVQKNQELAVLHRIGADQSDVYSVKAPVAGIVRYVNLKYFTASAPDSEVPAGDILMTVDTENVRKAIGVLSINAEIGTDYTMWTGSVLELSASDSTESFTGTISDVTYTQNGRQGTLNYFISLKNVPDSVRVGDKLSVVFTEPDVAKDCLRVPCSAVYSFGGRSFVYVLDENGDKTECYVEAGLSNDSYVEILSGLTEGQEIVRY